MFPVCLEQMGLGCAEISFSLLPKYTFLKKVHQVFKAVTQVRQFVCFVCFCILLHNSAFWYTCNVCFKDSTQAFYFLKGN